LTFSLLNWWFITKIFNFSSNSNYCIITFITSYWNSSSRIYVFSFRKAFIIRKVSLLEIIHFDVWKSIIASIISYFNFQSIFEVGQKKTKQIKELFENMESVYNTAKDEITHFFCYIHDSQACSNVSFLKPIHCTTSCSI
jgi:hypothetical protein